MKNLQIKPLFISIIIIAAYYLTARAGLHLHMPDGQASIVWPAAGIAMGAVYAMGYGYAIAVFCGALLSSLYFYDSIGVRELSIASAIAFGAALQAAAGAFFIDKFVNRESTLENARDIGKLMFFAGPVACCISAFVATATLTYVEVLPSHVFTSHMYSWWLGDVFGVLVFAPLIILNYPTKERVGKVSLKRKLLVSTPVILVFCIFLTLFFSAKHELQDRGRQEYDNTVSALVNDFQKDLAVDFTNLIAIKSFFNSSEYVSADEFRTFTAPLLENASGMFGVSWLPKVVHEERDAFEQSIREQGYSNFGIRSRTGHNTLEYSPKEAVYFPLAYTEPYEKNKTAHGFDVYGKDVVSGNLRKQVLDQARDMANKKATSRFAIVQKEDQYGFIVYQPVYEGLTGDETAVDLRTKHIGYINGIFVFPWLMQELHKKTTEMGYDVVAHDVTNPKKIDLLYDSRTQDFKEGESESYIFDSPAQLSKNINVAGRNWQVTVIKNASLLSDVHIRELWYLVNGGLLFNALLSILFLTITARTEHVEKLVALRTQDLQQANAELEEFSYRTSHDLRSPLMSSIGLLSAVENMVEKGEKEKTLKSVRLVSDSLKKLESLVQDLLALTHLKGVEEKPLPIDFETMVKDALVKFGHMENFDRLSVSTDFKCDKKVVSLQSRVRLIVENLITNAIKYQDLGKDDSYIKISTRKHGKGILFEIEDNGLGIPKEKHDSLFEMFSRFHPKVSYGSGLGLYMMKKSADILKAELSFEDMPEGTKFTFILPS